MDTKELKKMLKNSTAVLILDNGEPSYVVLDYASYKKLTGDKEEEKEVPIHHGPAQAAPAVNTIAPAPKDSFHSRLSEKEAELLERINKEILALKDEIEKEEKGPSID